MFVGHLGSFSLAGVSIANVGIQGLAFGIMLGMASAVQTVSGQAYGAKKYVMLGVICQKALILHIIASLTLSIFYCFSGTFLRAIQLSADIAAIAQSYARGLIPQLLAYAIYLPLQRFLQAQNIITPIAYLSIGVFVVHVGITWIVIHVIKGGVLGAALSLSFSLEIWYNQGIILISGLLKDPEIALDSISICANYLTWDMMLMLGLSNAASVRIGNELGARHPKVAKLSVFVVVSWSLIISIILSGIVLIFKVLLSKLYTSSEEVIQAVKDLTPLLAFSIFLNGIQPILSGVAIGSGWQEIVAYVNVGAYYFIGLPIGCVLGFKTSLRVTGIWWGLIIGVFVQTVCLITITARTDWSKEVVKASKRVKNTDDDENLVTFGKAE
ncbi:MATE efflux family protein [Zostera marina]|uniref:MATE efflux family protein n=1 Tax=Zostera marina TaxID=29655 RepID=A0A0K9PMG0_ZOSMR|nr:MATE efflux family protein [Zostera marina]